MIRNTLLTVLSLLIVLSPIWARAEMHMTLDEPFSGFSSNDVGDIVYMDLPGGERVIWVGTAKGLSKTSDGGATWSFYDLRNGLNQNIISALAASGTTLWAATSYDKLVQGELYPYGRGFNATQDLGDTWDSFIPFQVSRYAGMVCYDIAIDDTTVWASAWYGGLIRSQDGGENWENVFVDSAARVDFEDEIFQDLRNYFFAVAVDTACPIEKTLKNSVNDIFYDGTLLWVATQNGLQTSVSLGNSWFEFDTGSGLGSNGVYCLGGDTSGVWIGLYQEEETHPLPVIPSLTGADLNSTTDNGNTWSVSSPDLGQASSFEKFAFDIAVADTVVWAACGKGGLIRSFDRGQTWENVFEDTAAQRRFEDGDLLDKDVFISMAVDTSSPGATTVWAGTRDGLYKFVDAPKHTGAPSQFGGRQASYGLSNVLIPNLEYCTKFGGYVCLPVMLDNNTTPFGGFELVVEFDYNMMTFVGAEPGEPIEDFERFTYRLLPCPQCGGDKYKILVYGQYDMPDGIENTGDPILVTPEGVYDTLVELCFVVKDNENLGGLKLPVCFCWEGTIDLGSGCLVEDWDCGENTFWSLTRDTLYTSMLCCQFVPELCEDLSDNLEAKLIFQYGVCQQNCGNIEVCTVGVEECSRGDVNYNTIAYEVADAVLFASYFVYGTSVFHYNVDYQVCATDINADGEPLMLDDLMYMVLVILHEAPEIPKWTPSQDTAYFSVSDGRVMAECALPIGAVLLEFDAPVYPTLMVDMEMVHSDNKVLVWSSVGKSFTSAEVLTADAELLSASAVARDSRVLTTVIAGEGKLPFKSVLSIGIQEYDQSKIIWASACSQSLEVSSCSTYKSTDDGETWSSHLGGVIVRDFAFLDSAVWAASNEGLKRSTDGGENWDTFEIIDSTSGQTIIPSQFTSVCVVPYVTDTFVFVGSIDGLARSRDDGVSWDVTKFAHSFKKAIWAGTAAGILKFIFNYRDVADTVLQYWYPNDNITGNWIVALAIQEYDSEKVVWAATQRAYSGGYGASFSTDDGDSWDTTLVGDEVWNFAFDDTVIWAATSAGLKRTDDWGENWGIFNYMQDQDPISQAAIWSTEFTSVTIIDGEVWAGNIDGLVKGTYDGQAWGWDVIRTAVPETYAYPSPFSPILQERVRIHYRPQKDGLVTVKIYDFAMNLVITLADGKDAVGGAWYDEFWDGRNEKGDVVANGVYFFKVQAPDGQTDWGKLVILK